MNDAEQAAWEQECDKSWWETVTAMEAAGILNANMPVPYSLTPAAEALLDELLTTANDGMLAKLEAGFDPDAGLADILARLEDGQP
jgi:hypothetical protein